MSKFQCMSLKLIVKHAKCCGPSLCRLKNRRRRSRYLPPRSLRQNSGGGCLDARNHKEGGGATKPYGDPISAPRFCPAWYFVDLDRENQNARRGYSGRRSTMAKQLGLGRTRGASVEMMAVPEVETQMAPKTPTPRRRSGRPRTPRS